MTRLFECRFRVSRPGREPFPVAFVVYAEDESEASRQAMAMLSRLYRPPSYDKWELDSIREKR